MHPRSRPAVATREPNGLEISKDHPRSSSLYTPEIPYDTMASALTLGLGILGAGLAGRVGMQMWRASRGGAEQFVKGGFKAKMDKTEALAVLGLR